MVCDAYGIYIYEMKYPGKTAIVYESQFNLLQLVDFVPYYSSNDFKIYIKVLGFDLFNIVDLTI